MNKSNIFEVVSKGVADILYTKKDGTERVIKHSAGVCCAYGRTTKNSARYPYQHL